MPLINCKVEWNANRQSIVICDFSMIGAVSADNDDGANSNNIIFYYKIYKILGSRRHVISKKKKKTIKSF